MARISANEAILTLLLLTITFNHGLVVAFVTRMPLHMTNGVGGSQQIATSDSDEIATTSTTFLSVSTSPSPLTPTKQGNGQSDGTNFSQNVYRNKGRPKKVVKKVGAPLVDSTLLRFLSAQKSQIAAQGRIRNNDVTSSNDIISSDSDVDGNSDSNGSTVAITSTGTITNSTKVLQIKEFVNETELIQSITDNLKIDDGITLDAPKTNKNRKQDASPSNIRPIPTSTSASTQVADTTADSISWFTQYNAHVVAKKLVTLGASEMSAQEAGNAVQNYSLTRTTRQRVRKFLSVRDSIWASSPSTKSNGQRIDEVAYQKKESTDINYETTKREQTYNIDGIIEVLTDAGLTGKDVAAIFTHTPSVSMMLPKRDSNSDNASSDGVYLEDNLNRVYFGVLCSVIKLRKYDARKVLRTCPGLLTKRGSTSSEEVISILANLGVAPTSLCRDKSALPILLSRSPASLFRLVAFLSSDAVRMPVNRIGPLFRRSECLSLLDHVAPLSHKPSSGDSFTVDNLFSSGGHIVETEITRRYKMMFQTAKCLRRVVGIKDLGRAISAFPNILTLDIRKQIKPCVEYLCDEDGAGLYADEIPSVLGLYPQLLGMNITHMQKNVEFLASLEIDEEDIGSIFRAFPALLTLDVSNMEKVVSFLKGVGVKNIGRFVTRLPPVLGYSIENDLIPKWQYLTSVRKYYASFEISRFPAYFSYPFDRVIKSRYEYLRDVKQFPIELLAVDQVLRYGDNDFATLVARDEDGTLYKAFVDERKKLQKGKNRNGKRKKNQ